MLLLPLQTILHKRYKLRYKFLHMINLYFGNHLKSADTQVYCNIGKSTQNPVRFSDFLMLQLLCMFLYNIYDPTLNLATTINILLYKLNFPLFPSYLLLPKNFRESIDCLAIKSSSRTLQNAKHGIFIHFTTCIQIQWLIVLPGNNKLTGQ